MVHRISRLPPKGRVLLLLGLLSVIRGEEPVHAAVVSPQNEAAVEAALDGVVVEEVAEGSALERAGVEPGDLLLSWERLANPPSSPEPAAGTLGSPFDWLWLEVEQAPRGTVQLVVQRDGEEQLFEVAPGLWQGKIRPRMAGATLKAYLQGKERLGAEDLEGAASRWAEVAERESVRGWMLFRIGETWAEARAWDQAHAFYRSALEVSEEPQARVAVWRSVGMAHRRRSEFHEATEAFESARELGEGIWGEKSLAVAQLLNSLGAVAGLRGDLDRAADDYARALEIRQKLAPRSLDVADSLSHLGLLARNRGDLDRAADLCAEALEIQQELAPESLVVAHSLGNLGLVARTRGELDRAVDHYEEALEIQQKLAPENLGVSRSLNSLGVVAWMRGDLDRAAEYFTDALEIRQRLVPDSLDVANSLNNLGLVASHRGDLDRTAAYFTEALEIKKKLAPGSLSVAESLSNLGVVSFDRGDMDQAADYYSQALEIQQELAPESLGLTGSLNNLGLVALNRGDLDRAIGFFTRTLEIQKKLAPDSLGLATSLNNLGLVVLDRGDPDRAAGYFKEALEIKRKLAPGSLSVALSLGNLGRVAWHRGDLDRAANYYSQALELRQMLAPGSLDAAGSLNNLGLVALDRGDLDRAADYFEESLELRQKVAPGSLDVAASLNNLGTVAWRLGDLDRAAVYHTGALDLRQKLAPETSFEAETLHALGLISRKQNKLQVATSLFHRALESLEGQVGKLGGSHDSKAGFRARRRFFYQDQIEVQLELNRSAQAFHTLERSRAQSFLAQLAERELGFSGDLSEELEQERRRAKVAHDRILDRFHQESSKSPAERQKLLEALEESRFRRTEIQAKIRRESPRLAAVLYPEPLDLRSAQELLEPGELLLSYSIGEEKSLLFVVGSKPEDFAVQELETNAEKLEGQVRRMRFALKPSTPPELSFHRGRSLWIDLFEPIRSRIGGAERLILVPDGPLHLLPFGALPESGTPEEPRYLIESRPLSIVASATVLRELRERRRHRAAHSLVAFGAPRYPSARAAAERSLPTQLRLDVERGLHLGTLPYTRTEVESLARLFPERSEIYLGAAATEERAKALGENVSLIHFATHGLVNEHLPLESSLALTIPERWREGEENGLLQVWEIYDQVRLDADLVTLSACETALGEELSGEGILGLTRAFQFAGAKSVVASLWGVNDQATAELMKRFYRNLRRGMARDEALRQAQMTLLVGALELGEGRQLRTGHPFYWAAFQLYGDWR